VRARTRAPSRRHHRDGLVAILASTLTTEWIGIHAIFGAFVLGAIMVVMPLVTTLARRRSSGSSPAPAGVLLTQRIGVVETRRWESSHL